jgi:hypothetical protein
MTSNIVKIFDFCRGNIHDNKLEASAREHSRQVTSHYSGRLKSLIYLGNSIQGGIGAH